MVGGNISLRVPSLTVCLELCFYTMVVGLGSVVGNTWTDYIQPAQNNKAECPKSIPCRWALCPWTKRPYLPSERLCIMVNNNECACVGGERCVLSDISDPGTTYIKYEYQCKAADSQESWPALRNFFGMTKRGVPGGANINDVIYRKFQDSQQLGKKMKQIQA